MLIHIMQFFAFAGSTESSNTTDTQQMQQQQNECYK